MIIDAADHWKSGSIELYVLDTVDATQKYVSWLNDPAVSRFLESRFMTHSIKSTSEYIGHCRQSKNSLLLGIRYKGYGHVGNIKVDTNPIHGYGEIGIMLGERSIYGQGVASRAIAIMVQITQHDLRLRKLGAGCYASNIGSEKAFVKSGFVVEGVRPAHFLLDDKPESLTLLGLLL